MADYHIGGGQGASGGNRLGIMTEGLGFPLREVSETSVRTEGVTATDDAGNGTVEGDVNATDFTSQVGTTFLPVTPDLILTIVHKAVAYLYQGPRGVNIGAGGDYVTANSDYAVLGTGDHALLSNLNAGDQHPQAAITGLVADQAQQDQNLVDHETDPNPHDQYVLNSEGLALWVAAGYGGILQSAIVGLPNITGTFQVIPADSAVLSQSEHVTQDFPNNGLRFQVEGIWALNVQIAIEHNSSNSGRILTVQLFNDTANAVVAAGVVATGRNAEATNISVVLLAEVTALTTDDLFQIRLGSTSDTYTSVQLDGFQLSSWHVSEAKNISQG